MPDLEVFRFACIFEDNSSNFDRASVSHEKLANQEAKDPMHKHTLPLFYHVGECVASPWGPVKAVVDRYWRLTFLIRPDLRGSRTLLDCCYLKMLHNLRFNHFKIIHPLAITANTPFSGSCLLSN